MAPDRSLTAKIQHEMNFVEADPNSKKYKYTPPDKFYGNLSCKGQVMALFFKFK